MAGEQAERGERRGWIVDQVADDDDHCAALQVATINLQASGDIGRALRGIADHEGHELAQVIRARAWRNEHARLAAEKPHADRVLLL